METKTVAEVLASLDRVREFHTVKVGRSGNTVHKARGTRTPAHCGKGQGRLSLSQTFVVTLTPEHRLCSKCWTPEERAAHAALTLRPAPEGTPTHLTPEEVLARLV